MDIVNELRKTQQYYQLDDMLSRAAAEIESLRAACKGTTVSCVCGGQGEIDKLRAELAEVRKENASFKHLLGFRDSGVAQKILDMQEQDRIEANRLAAMQEGK